MTILRPNLALRIGGIDYIGNLVLDYYVKDNNIALRYMRGGYECIAILTVWLPGLAEDELAIKDYGENNGAYAALIKAHVIHQAHREVSSGYVSKIPVCRLQPDIVSLINQSHRRKVIGTNRTVR